MNMLNIGQAVPPQIMQLAQLMRVGNNPQIALSVLAQQYPEMGALLQMPGGASSQNMEQFCKMVCQQKGVDYNSVIQQAQMMMKQLNM